MLKKFLTFLWLSCFILSFVCLADVPEDDVKPGTGGFMPPDGMPLSEQETTYLSTDDGMEYVLYTTDGAERSGILCVILMPSSRPSDSFMELTEWTFFSRLSGYDILCARADWSKDAEGARQYLESIYTELSEPSLSSYTSVFLIGYDDGADFAAIEACENTGRYTGLITFGGGVLSDEQIAACSQEDKVTPLSVWMFSSGQDAGISRTLDFWKERNRITPSPFTSFRVKFADQCYMPFTSTAGRITDASGNMGIVLYSRQDDYYDHSVTGNVSRNFVLQVKKDEIAFRDAISGGGVFGIDDWHFTYYRRQFEGQQRDYWVYVPDTAIFGDEQPKVILCLHGNGGSGEDMIFRSMWHETAAENNCIVIYPSSLYKSGAQHYWQNMDEEMYFLRDLIGHICTIYNADRSRIYVTGFSNGAGMAHNLAVKCSDIFAAAVMGAPVYFDSDYYGPPDEMHEVAVMYSCGTDDPYLDAYDTSVDIYDWPAMNHLEYWRILYGFSQAFYSCEKSGDTTVYTYTNGYNIPICKWVIVQGKTHEYPREEVEMYYDFMQRYTKGENGELYYYGEIVYSCVSSSEKQLE